MGITPDKRLTPGPMKLYLYIALMLMMLLSSCRGKEFSVDFDLGQEVEANYHLLYYASDKRGGRWIERAAPIHLGKYTAEFQTINPTVVYIFRSSGKTPETFFYAERGDKITITGESANPLKWDMKGNRLTERLSEWRSANLKAITEGDHKAVNKAVTSYIEKNPHSEIDPLLLLLSYDRQINPEGFVKLWNSMDEKLRKGSWESLVPSPDLCSLITFTADDKGKLTLLPGDEKFPTLNIRSLGKGRDTLRFNSPGRKASLVWFWHIGDPIRHQILDSLRNFGRNHREDSVRLLLADICLDGDSLRWKNLISDDSILYLKRGWWPEGIANPDAIRLGIGGYRSFMVFGPKGEVVYTGSDISDALSRLRKKLK